MKVSSLIFVSTAFLLLASFVRAEDCPSNLIGEYSEFGDPMGVIRISNNEGKFSLVLPEDVSDMIYVDGTMVTDRYERVRQTSCKNGSIQVTYYSSPLEDQSNFPRQLVFTLGKDNHYPGRDILYRSGADGKVVMKYYKRNN